MISQISDFTYNSYLLLLDHLKKSYNLAQLQDAVSHIRTNDRVCFIRHDVDLSIDKALDMASIEAKNNINSTYHVFSECPYYSVRDKETKEKLKIILDMGHEIGLHTEERLPVNINFEIMMLERELKTQVKSMSFHRPDKDEIYTKFLYFDDIIIYAYSKRLMQHYVSDSRGQFREGVFDPNDSQVMQLLIHPFWWSEFKSTPNQKLARMLKDRWTKDKERLENHIGLQVEL